MTEDTDGIPRQRKHRVITEDTDGIPRQRKHRVMTEDIDAMFDNGMTQ